MSQSRPLQLSFAFAESPQGDGRTEETDASVSEARPAHTADDSQGKESTPRAAETARLLELVCTQVNLRRALAKVARNDGAPGIDRQTARAVVRSADKLLPQLQDALLSGAYVPGDIRRVWIPKPDGGQRGLGIPNVVDRWVQQALLQVLEPIFEPTFHASSHGFRPKRGAHTAIAEAAQYVKEGRRYTVDLDLEKFFDRVNHQRLLDHLGQRVKDRRVLRIVRLMLKASVVLPDGVRVTTSEGTPQGGPLSPLLSNIVLDELDRELARRRLCFVRYADDCNIYVRSERAGKRVMASIRRFIEKRLKLKVNEAKSAVDLAQRRHFLGFRIGASRKGWLTVQLSRRSVERLDARLRQMTPRNWGNSLQRCCERLNQYLQGWMGYFRLCTREVCATLHYFDGHVRRRIRAIIVKQKKHSRHLYRHLRRHGAGYGSAHSAAYSRRGIWWKSRSHGMNTVHDTDWFAERLVSLERLWHQKRYDWRPLWGARPEEPDVRSTRPVP
jgi:RNA-directed DNA polymerase